jgi:hypothetical protein
MDPTAPISTEEFDIFAFLCQFRKDILIGEAAGGVVLISILISMIATCIRYKKMTKTYKIPHRNSFPSIIVTDNEDEFPPHPRFDSAVPLTSTPLPLGTWV